MNLFLSANSAFCELIETLWNVNEKMIAFLTKMMNELIETLWNVNEKMIAFLTKMMNELIETLWNVNSNAGKIVPVPVG